MVQFGKKLLAARYLPWTDHYLDYKKLKKKISSVSEYYKNEQERVLATTSSQKAFSSTAEPILPQAIVEQKGQQKRFEFERKIHDEIEKVVLFFLETQGSLASQLTSLRKQQHDVISKIFSDASESPLHMGNPTSNDNLQSQLQDILRSYRLLGESIYHLVHFLELNATAVRKILKKHDKKLKQYARPLASLYWSVAHDNDVDCHLRQLYRYDGIAALVTSLKWGVFECHVGILALGGDGEVTNVGSLFETIGASRPKDENISRELVSMLSSSHRSTLLPSAQDEWLDEYEPIFFNIRSARNNLRTSTVFLRTVAADLLLLSSDDEDDIQPLNAASFRSPPTHKKTSRISSMLNLLSALLYMTNYYIIAPTSGKMLLKLDASPSLSGLMIGMTPIAACVSAVLYSWWANRSYKSALLFASGCSALGNIFYAMALPCNALWMVIVGRLLNGFGGARAINRRYIADNFERNERTSASAAFVTASALGMSLGPALAAGLGVCPEVGWWTVETSPGWVMFGAWIIYLVCTMVYFEEPEGRENVKKNYGNISNDEEALPLKATSLDSQKNGYSGHIKLSLAFHSLFSNRPVMISLANYFLLKFALEILLSSAEPVTFFYFSWTTIHVGVFLAIIGLLMFPANLLVAYASSQRGIDDRDLIILLLTTTIFGSTGILNVGEVYTTVQYIFFGIIVFLSTNALESVNMSLLSKTIPKSWARGTFNSGLLATEAGTAGRALGDVFITVVAQNYGFSELLNKTFAICALGAIGMLILVLRSYDRLEEGKDEDDENDD